MPPGKSKPPGQARPARASSAKEVQDVLWKAAAKLRGSVDAAQYKEFVLGLVFLKYVSDAFEERRAALAGELAAAGVTGDRLDGMLEERAKYTEAHVFWVPRPARWPRIAAGAAGGAVGALLDGAMEAIMQENAVLAGVLPKIFQRDGVDSGRLGQLVSLIGSLRFHAGEKRPAQDVLGEVYEYFLGTFARAEGKRAGEFYTPRSVVQLIVEVLEPYQGRVYDPACGSGGMFVQAATFVEAHRGRGRKADISVYGQELNERTWRLGRMNLAIHGIEGDLGPGWGDTFADDKHPDLKADFVMANPPFNIKDWARDEDDPRWTYGVPPRGNANFAWLQHVVSKLAERGTAGIVLANGSMSSRHSGEGEIRRALVEDDLVACVVALPPQLFRTAQIPACLWFLARDKGPQGDRRLADRRGEILFVDARRMGELADRTERVLTGADIDRIAGAYHAWRGTPAAREEGAGYADEPGFCLSAGLEAVRGNGYVLTPGRYVGAPGSRDEDGDEAIGDRIERLRKQLLGHFEEAALLEDEVLGHLDRLGG